MKTKRLVSSILAIILIMATSVTTFAATTKTNSERISDLKKGYQINVSASSVSDKMLSSNLTTIEQACVYVGPVFSKALANKTSTKRIDVELEENNREQFSYYLDKGMTYIWSGGGNWPGNKFTVEMRGTTLSGQNVPAHEVVRMFGDALQTLNYRTRPAIFNSVSYDIVGGDGTRFSYAKGDFISEKAKKGAIENYNETFTWGIIYGADKPCPYPQTNQVWKCGKAVFDDLVALAGYGSTATQRMAGYLGIDISKQVASAGTDATPPTYTTEEIAKFQAKFEKWYTNDLVVINAKQGKNTVKTNIKNPVFIQYNPTANKINTLAVQYTAGNGSITFTASAGGIIVVSEGKLAK